MKVASLIAWFEDWVNPIWQENWDNCGWQVKPDILEESAQVLVCLTPTIEVIEEAIALKADGVCINLIITHHPLIFSPLKSLQVENPITEVIRLSFAHKIGIYSAHTNFDQVRGGTADVLAQLLELKQVRPLVVKQEERGYGRIGHLEPYLTLKQLLDKIKCQLSTSNLVLSPSIDFEQIIQRVAVLGGSGASFIFNAIQEGAEVYLTSDCKFHQFQNSRDNGLILIDAGHYATERPACASLVEKFKALGLEWVQLSTKDEDFRRFY